MYKRQSENSIQESIAQIYIQILYAAESVRVNENTPVSYTHLDVYKRQYPEYLPTSTAPFGRSPQRSLDQQQGFLFLGYSFNGTERQENLSLIHILFESRNLFETINEKVHSAFFFSQRHLAHACPVFVTFRKHIRLFYHPVSYTHLNGYRCAGCLPCCEECRERGGCTSGIQSVAGEYSLFRIRIY